MQWLFTDRWEPILENKVLDAKVEGLNGRFYRTSVVLPGVLMVENWPEEHIVQYEWYVPITDDTYEYWEVLVKVCPTEEERKKFEYRYERVFKPLCLHGFNDCDLYAREAMHECYADGTGWDNEQLVATDVSPITWRKVASRHNRGIAKPGKGVDGAVKTSSIRLRRISDGVTVRVDADGAAVFGEGADSAFALVDSIIADLRAGVNVGAHVTAIDERTTAMLSAQGAVGARQAQIERAQEVAVNKSVSLETRRAAVEDVDTVEVLVQLRAQELVYQSSLQVTSRVLQPTLLDFLA
jgi:hypothetical protein